MKWLHAIFFGFGATIVLSILLSGARGMGFTRMDMTFLLGTMVTPDRDKARWIGFLIHVVNGWLFSLIYFLAFFLTGWGHWWFGMAIGLVHALFLLMPGMQVITAFHPRMATEQRGPDPTRLLEPPGFMALHYGKQTAMVTIVSHLIYGGILGYFCP